LWEAPLWNLYLQLKKQWRYNDGIPVGLDMNIFLSRIEAKGWDVDLALDLLSIIESEFLKKDE
jgi:hypothetical protein